MKVLLVDDDVELLDLLTYALRRRGYRVTTAINGQEALDRFEASRPDLILLDGNIPKIDGFEVCRRIRLDGNTPIIMLTARGDEEDIVRGLQLGADDYIVKPFSTKELTARMEAVCRRSRSDGYRPPVRKVEIGNITIDLASHDVKKAERTIHLTPLEFRLLHVLAANPGQVIPYEQLLQYGWNYPDESSSALLKTHISHLRRKLGLRPPHPLHIKAVYDVGYTLTQG